MVITFLTLFLAAVTFLVYEILLMKTLSIVGWSHYAYMVVSLSMLGLGFSGVILGLFPKFFRQNRDICILIGGFLFGLILPLTFYINQKLPLNYLYLVWDWRQFIYVGVSYFLYGIPFLIISVILAIFFLRHPKRTNQIYSVNLLGSGFGVFCAVVIMHYVQPEKYIFVCGVLGALMAFIWGLRYKKPNKRLILSFVFITILLINFFLIPSSLIQYISEYKGLPSLLRLPETKIIDTYFNPFGCLHVVEGEKIRIASGLSITYKERMPLQKAITFDADAPSPILDPGNINSAFFEDLIFSTAYNVKSNPKVLLIGAGGFANALLANYHNSRYIKVLEINPKVITALEKNMATSFCRWIKKANVKITKTDARSYIEKSQEEFDIIQMDPAGTLTSSASGLFAQNEDYLNTVESYKLFIHRLAPDGMFMISRWMNTPAKDGIKLFATGVTALEELDIENPQNNLVLIKNWDIITLLIKKEPFTAAELKNIKNFCDKKHFDISYFPGIEKSQTNRFHILPEPIYYLAAQSILNKQEREDFFTNYIFNVRPAVDNKPYFSHFFKWSALPYLIKTLGREWVPFSEYGYLILLASFIQSLVVGGLLILLPLGILVFKRGKESSVKFKFNTWLYFVFLGLSFMILEMGLIQKFILFLHNPIYSASIVIGSFLTISGIGSMISKKFFNKQAKYQIIPFIIITILAILYACFLDSLFYKLMGVNIYTKLLLSIIIIAPLALLLGIPFPLGMQKISPTGEVNTGIAWGCSGFFSVMGAILTPILAMLLGSQIVIIIGGLGYLLAMLMWKLKFD